MFAVAASLYFYTQCGHRCRKMWSRVLWSGVAGSIAGSLVATCLGVEIAEGVRKLYPEYWNWSRDVYEFAFMVVREALVCFAVGVAVAAMWCGVASFLKRIGNGKAVG